MGIMVSPETLRRMPLFAGLDHPLIKAFAMASEEIEIQKGEWLFHASERAAYLYIILDGVMEIKIPVKLRDVNIPGLTRATNGELLGWSALIDPYIYKMGAIAVKDTRLVKLDGVRMSELMTHNPAAGYKLMNRVLQVVGTRLVDLSVQFVSLVEGDRYQTLGGKHHL